MMFDKILEKVNETVSLNKEEKDYLKSILKFKKVNKKEYVLKQDVIENNYYFIISGCLRSYIIDKKGIEHVIQFSSKGWWITDNESLLYNKPTKFNISAAMDSEILILTKEAKEESIKKYSKLEKYYNEGLEKSIIFLRNRLNEILSLSAEERYLDFCEKFPDLKDQISQKYIASYIGVTPEFFSFMKKKLKTENQNKI